MAPQWQATAVTDFKSVAGKWGGISDFRRPESATLRSGDSSNRRYGGLRNDHNENDDNDAGAL